MTDRMTYYLKTICIDHFATMHDRLIGTFSPGLNVVFGPNESGKTTTAAFIGGVLFGWPDARGSHNDYRPIGAERSGTLIFAPKTSGGEEISCTRVRNAEGIKPDPEPVVLADIDRDTFRTVFSLDADELRRMGRTSDVCSHLLTAGSGTQVSPAQAAATINAQVANVFSRSASHPDSLPRLQEQLDSTRDSMNAQAAIALQLEQKDRKYTQLKSSSAKLSDSITHTNDQIRRMTAGREAIAQANRRGEQLAEDRRELEKQRQELSVAQRLLAKKRTKRYLALDAVEERTLRDAIDDATEEERRLEHTLSMAKQDASSSQAALDAIRETGAEHLSRAHKVRKRTVQSVLSILLPLLFAVMGIVVFMRGRLITSLSVTALGAMLTLFAIALACAAIVMLMRPDATEQRVNNQLADANIILQKDIRKEKACEEALEAHREKTEAFLIEEGLQAARGSLHRARALLDDASELRAEAALLDQKEQALASQAAQIDLMSDAVAHEKTKALAAFDKADDATLEEIDDLLARKTEQRDAQMHTAATMNEQLGELAHELAAARNEKEFDRVKLEHAQLQSRYHDTLEQLARLLLAKRLLDASIAAWEGKNQPAVYRKASELLAEMTNGTWTQVRLTAAGALVVVDDADCARAPELLSLGTLQQLYLALRIALLLIADNVGRSVPLLCDDILVSFDASRRTGAARALATLAQKRQIILFTCHEEVVDLMQTADAATNVICL